MSSWLSRIFGRASKEELLLKTHTPPAMDPEHGVGQAIAVDGRLYRITRWLEGPVVHLNRGGSVAEWEIWGVLLSDRELESAMEQAAGRILREADEGNGRE